MHMAKRPVDLVSDSLDHAYEAQEGQDVDLRTPKKRRGAEADPLSSAKEPKAQPKPKPKPKAKRIPARKCRGCRKKLTPDEQAPNWPGCWPCKRALDNITKRAHKQGETAVKFVQDARQDEERCYNMIQSYLEACPETCENFGKKRGIWSVVRYMERVTAASGLVRDSVGEMMWEKLYIEFAQTTRGGRLREEDAQLQWKEWEEAVLRRDGTVNHDHNGPNGKLRVWVHTKDTLTFRNSYMHEKGVDCVGKEIKKGTDADVDKLRPEILKNHGKNMSFDEIGAALCKNGDEAFKSTDGSGFLLDVLQLQKDVDGEEEDEVDAESKPGESAPPKPWVERDRQVSAAIRAAKSQVSAFADKGATQFNKLTEWKARSV